MCLTGRAAGNSLLALTDTEEAGFGQELRHHFAPVLRSAAVLPLDDFDGNAAAIKGGLCDRDRQAQLTSPSCLCEVRLQYLLSVGLWVSSMSHPHWPLIISPGCASQGIYSAI